MGALSKTINGKENAPNSCFSKIKKLLPLWPFILAMALARSGVIVGSYGSYEQTDSGFLTEGTTLVALALMALWLPFFIRNNAPLKRKTVKIFAVITMSLEGASLMLLSLLELTGNFAGPFGFFVCVGTGFFGMSSLFFWLRRIRGISPPAAAVVTFSALILSEFLIYACVLMPAALSYAVAAVFAFLQFYFWKKSYSKSKPFIDSSEKRPDDYFGYAKSLISSKQFLIVTAIGIGLMSIVIGFLRGYPAGEPISFTPETRVAYMVLTIAVSAAIIALVLRGKRTVMSLGVWLVMQGLASCALLAYAAFSSNLDLGAVFTTTLNAIMVAFTWYLIVAFMSYGWRDPYYYAIACFIVWIGSRAFARLALFNVPPLVDNPMLISIVIGTFLLFSAQVVYIQYISITNNENKNELEKTASRKSALEKIMGLDEHDTLADMRRSSMSENAKEIGAQFLLSEREIEVLTLYALGFTQKRVAEDLHISQSTVHTHIKRIYAKTGIHSRQALLDYIKEYSV